MEVPTTSILVKHRTPKAIAESSVTGRKKAMDNNVKISELPN